MYRPYYCGLFSTCWTDSPSIELPKDFHWLGIMINLLPKKIDEVSSN